MSDRTKRHRTFKVYPRYHSEADEQGYHLVEEKNGVRRRIALLAAFEDMATILTALNQRSLYDAMKAKLAHLAEIMGDPVSDWEAKGVDEGGQN
jgi:hypothetical protein